jgi:hypothetical protein
MKWGPLLAVWACLWAAGQLPAQAYRPFLNASQWRVEESGFQGIGFYWWMTGKDTVIQGENYLQGLDSVSPLPLFVQEDVAERRVWIASAFDAYQKRLLYDFSLSVGDTARLTFLGFPERAFVVTNLGSVNTTAGFMPQWTLQATDGGNPNQVVWAEGIGHEKHPFYLDYISVSDPSYRLICNYQQRVKLFDDGFGTCQSASPPLGVGDARAAWPGLRFDPSSNVLSLDSDFARQVRTLELYALDGRLLWRNEQPGAELVLPTMPGGLYALRAELRDGRVLGQRLHLW